MISNYPRVYLYRRIVQAKLFIDRNYAQSINLTVIAGEASFSKYHFIRLFKSIYKKTPHAYLGSVRMKKAEELLLSGLPVSDVCYAVGFESLSSFAGWFKHKAGCSPSFFQVQQKKVRAAMLEKPLSFVPNCFAEKNGWLKKSNFQEAG